MDDFFGFRRMLTPPLIELAFILGALACVILGLVCVGMGIGMAATYDPFGFSRPGREALIGGGVSLAVFGPFAVRLVCEVLIVPYRINETLTDQLKVLEEIRAHLADARSGVPAVYPEPPPPDFPAGPPQLPGRWYVPPPSRPI